MSDSSMWLLLSVCTAIPLFCFVLFCFVCFFFTPPPQKKKKKKKTSVVFSIYAAPSIKSPGLILDMQKVRTVRHIHLTPWARKFAIIP